MTSMLTIHQCAMRLNVAEALVRRLIQAGKLPGAKIGKEWRVDPADLEAFIAGARPVRSEPVIHDDERLPPIASPRFA